MKQISIYVIVFLCLNLSNIFAQDFPSQYYQNEVLIDVDDEGYFEDQDDGDYIWHLNRNVIFSTDFIIKAPNITGDEFALVKINDDDEITLSPGEELNITLPVGHHSIRLDGESMQNGDIEKSKRKTYEFQVKQGSPYISPNEVWEITLDPDEYSIPVNNLYPSNSSLKAYNLPQEKQAIATVTLGEGNTTLRRPLIMVDGVDFSHDIVLEEGTDRVVRYGGTGWESVVQGLSTDQVPEDELELFRAYPEIINEALTGQSDNGNVNYDVILVEFQDGADYIDRCAKLLRKVIERVNEEKTCEFENVIVGLSMGGQVTRFALTEMEADGVDHHCRQYISFDSPHEYANIPLGIQAFVYTAGYLANNETIKAKFDDLNRPAALQMLIHNIYEEVELGNLTMIHTTKGLQRTTTDIPTWETVTFNTTVNLHAPPKRTELRAYYTNKQATLGYPKLCKNIAIADGSGIGTPLLDTDCLLDGEATYESSALVNLIASLSGGLVGVVAANLLLTTIDDDLAAIKINSIGSTDDMVMKFNFANTGDVGEFFNSVTVMKNIEYQNWDIAPGCARSDIGFLGDEFAKSVTDAFPGPLNIETTFSCREAITTFMPTAAVIGVETNNLLADLKQEILIDKTLVSPFDEIFLPYMNLDHVEVKLPGEDNLQGNDLGSFLYEHLDDNIFDLPELVVLPSQDFGNTYNYGLYQHRLTSFTINDNAALNINHKGYTHFVDTDNEAESKRLDFSVATLDTECSNPVTITINSGGVFNIGQSGQHKNGHVIIKDGSQLILNSGSELNVNNNSSLTLHEGSTFEIFDDHTINFSGQNSKLVLAGHFKTTGDLTINMNGKIVIQPSATFDLGGKLTIVGDKNTETLIVLNNSVTANLNNDILIQNGMILSGNNGKIVVNDASNFTLNNVIVKPANTNSSYTAIELYGVDNITIERANFLSFCSHTGLLINGSEDISIKNSTFSNSEHALIMKNFAKAKIQNTEVLAKVNYCLADPGFDQVQNPENNNGVYAQNGDNLTIKNSRFTGFTNGLPSSSAYGIKLEDVKEVFMEESRVEGNGYGISIPIHNGIGNKTNLHIARSTIKDNKVGISMHGQKASSSTGNINYGRLILECARLLDNYHANVKGLDILVIADSYLTNNEAPGNSFRHYDKYENGEYHRGWNFYIDYHQYSFLGNNEDQEVYLRGNFWFDDEVRSSFTSYITYSDGEEIVVIADPMYASTSIPESCISIIQVGYEDPCINCLVEDENDCSYVLYEDRDRKSINSTYIDGINLYRSQRGGHIEEFQKLASMNTLALGSLQSKCKFQYEVSRTFAVPNTNNDPRENNGPKANDPRENRFSEVVKEFTLFPNPASNEIAFDNLENCQLTITDLNGRIAKQLSYEKGHLVDISDLTSGIYFISNNVSNQIEKLIVVE